MMDDAVRMLGLLTHDRANQEAAGGADVENPVRATSGRAGRQPRAASFLGLTNWLWISCLRPQETAASLEIKRTHEMTPHRARF